MRDLVDVPQDGVDLRRAFAGFPNGVVAVCAEIDGVFHGMAVSTFVPVSLKPPLVSFCVDDTSTTWPRLATAGRLGLSLLTSAQHETARAFGSRAGDRFAGADVHRGDDGALFIDGASSWIEGSIETCVPAGDHAVILLRIHRLTMQAEADPLVFHGSRFRSLRIDLDGLDGKPAA
ncbi:flavin reductase family protein [Kribbella sp. NBC_00709]|uniref:flavin reductase family protein n=1 Tax=Kribbella sp. NBC_00709 TaxID=2975972 RepID=UPI002E2D7884|nr:flavin reductase family protein [Kribbella sp. NBC_00709]